MSIQRILPSSGLPLIYIYIYVITSLGDDSIMQQLFTKVSFTLEIFAAIFTEIFSFGECNRVDWLRFFSSRQPPKPFTVNTLFPINQKYKITAIIAGVNGSIKHSGSSASWNISVFQPFDNLNIR